MGLGSQKPNSWDIVNNSIPVKAIRLSTSSESTAVFSSRSTRLFMVYAKNQHRYVYVGDAAVLKIPDELLEV